MSSEFYSKHSVPPPGRTCKSFRRASDHDKPDRLYRLRDGPGDGHVTAVEHIPFGHKFALRALRAGDPVIKYGARIGTATQDIVPGEHVHLHNMRSDFDERASTLDAETALPEDVVYELY